MINCSAVKNHRELWVTGGAFAVQLIAHTGNEQDPMRVLVGYYYEFVVDAKSAFDMELRGLEHAVNICRQSCQ